MSKAAVLDASRPQFDQVIQDIVDYVIDYDVTQSDEAMQTARYDWMDTIGCGLLALSYPACTKLLGPIVPGADMPGNGARVPGTSHLLGRLILFDGRDEFFVGVDHPVDQHSLLIGFGNAPARRVEPLERSGVFVSHNGLDS